MFDLNDSDLVWVIDLDGVIWRGPEPIAGSADAIGRLQAAGRSVVFATNSAARTQAMVEDKLRGCGIEANGHVVTSAMAAATLVSEGERVFVIGQEGLRQAVHAAGGVIVEVGQPSERCDDLCDTVVIGIDRGFDYEALRFATRAVLAGARLVASNTDVSFPAADGIDPGAGSIVAAVETATGSRAEVAGKPHRPMADLIRDRWGRQGVCVGDRPETDGDFAVELGFDFALVLSGVTAPEDLPVSPTPRLVTKNLAALVDTALQ